VPLIEANILHRRRFKRRKNVLCWTFCDYEIRNSFSRLL